MYEDLLADYCKAIAVKFGITGVYYDAESKSIAFPCSSPNEDRIPKPLQGQPISFFAFLIGSLAVGTNHIEVRSTENGALLQIKGSDSFVVEYFMDACDEVLKTIEMRSSRSDAAKMYRAFIGDYHRFMDTTGLDSFIDGPKDNRPFYPNNHTSRTTGRSGR